MTFTIPEPAFWFTAGVIVGIGALVALALIGSRRKGGGR